MLDKKGLVLLLCIVAASAAVRFAALFNDLWLDEIWTLKAISQLTSPLQIFTVYHIDNNHPLNSLWIAALYPAKVDWIYRIFSWMSGVCGVWLASRIASNQLGPDATLEQRRAVTVFTAVLLGASYFLIVYSSEARGYAPALAFSLAAFWILQTSRANARGGRIVAYWIMSVLALLSHAVSLQLIVAAPVWSLLQRRPATTADRERVRQLFAWHFVPVLACVGYYALFLRRMNIGGGVHLPIRQVLGDLAAYTFGLSPGFAGVTFPLLGIALFLALWRLWVRTSPTAVLYALLIFVPVVAALLAARATIFFPRYFIFTAVWSLMLFGYSAGTLWTRSPAVRAGLIVVTLLFVTGNAYHVARLLKHGRGEYQAAIRYIANHTTTPDIRVASDHDNRNFLLIDYYGPRNAPGRRIIYLTGNRTTPDDPQWLLVHRFDGQSPPDNPLYDDRGNVYQLEKTFPHAPLSGWDWFVFRNVRPL